MRWRRFLFALAAPYAALSAAPAQAADHAQFALDFGGAPGCPLEQAFEEALRARLPEARRVPERAGVPLLRVRLSVDSGQRRTLWLLLPDGTGVQREVSDAACSEAVQSMAVISAIALEASQRQAAELERAPSVSAPREPPPNEAAALAAPSSAPVAPTAPISAVIARAVPTSSGPEVPQRAARRAEPWRGRLGFAGGVVGGMAPRLAPIVAVEAEYVPRNTGTWALSALFAESGGAAPPAVDVHFRLLAGRLAFCPAWLHRAPWGATSCIEGELGQLRASASGVNHATAQSMPWLGLGLTGRGELALSAALAVTAQALVRTQIVHDRFILEPSRTIYQVPIIAGEFVVGLSVAWH